MNKARRIISVICAMVMVLALFPSLQGNANAANSNTIVRLQNPEKTYVLEAYCGKYVDISGISKDTGANAHLWEKTNGLNQQWVLTMKDADGFGYMIKSVNSDKYLDVAGVSRSSGANIYQWNYTGAANQIWYLEDAGDGYVFIRSGMGTYMDVSGNGTANGTNIQTYSFNGTVAQKFKLREVVDNSGTYTDAQLVKCLTVENGTYLLEARCGKVAEALGGNLYSNIQLGPSRNIDCQRVKVTFNGMYCTFRMENSGLMLDVDGCSPNPGRNIHLWSENGVAGQKWALEDAGNGYVFIRSALGTYMDIAGNGKTSTTNIQTWSFNGCEAQQFKLVKAPATAAPMKFVDVADGTYYLEAGCGKVVEVTGTENGSNVQIGTNKKLDSQKIQVTKGQDGFYSLAFVNSGRLVDIPGNSRYVMQNIHVWQATGATCQKWLFEDAGNGYVYLRSGWGTYMDVAGDYSTDGTNIQTYEFNGSRAQKYILREVGSEIELSSKTESTESTNSSTAPDTVSDASLISVEKPTIYVRPDPYADVISEVSLLEFEIDEQEASAWTAYRNSRLAESEAKRIVDSINALKKGKSKELSISYGGKTMKFFIKVFGNQPADGYPVYFALHGGGANKSANDDEYRGFKTRYNPGCGIYIVPRAVDDTWDCHWLPQSFVLYDHLIEYLILTDRINVNRVYFAGYSAGGDGVYGVTARMPDRFAAANMSAGHPNGVSLVNLKNMPIQLQVGDNDEGYFRNLVTPTHGVKLDELAQLYGGYIHRTYVHYNTDHGDVPDDTTRGIVYKDPNQWLTDRKAAPTTRVNPSIFAFMNQYTRDPLPKTVNWDLTARAASRSVNSFYYLTAAQNVTQGLIIASYDRSANRVTLTAKDLNDDFSILLNNKMIDFGRPVTFVVNGKTATMSLTPDYNLLARTTAERGDPNYQFEASVSYSSLVKLAK